MFFLFFSVIVSTMSKHKILIVALMLSVFVVAIFGVLSARSTKKKQQAYVAVALYSDKIVRLIEGKYFYDIKPTFFILKSSSRELSAKDIVHYQNDFRPFRAYPDRTDRNASYWLKVDLGKAFPEGRFVSIYEGFDVVEDTVAVSQHPIRFVFNGRNHLIFTYTKGKDPQCYYFKIRLKEKGQHPIFIAVTAIGDFFALVENHLPLLLMVGVTIGIIFMAGVYNGAIYLFNKAPTHLYYTLMQSMMVASLLIASGVLRLVSAFDSAEIRHYYDLSVLGIALFAGLFSLHFLGVKKFSRSLYRVFQAGLWLIAIDLGYALFSESLIMRYDMLPLFVLPLLYAGYKKAATGYKPALFYLAGWIALGVAVALDTYGVDGMSHLISPIYIGAPLEAILFSLALSYKIRMEKEESELQRELLVHQSKLASMGELLGNIAHQWRQPLTSIGYSLMNLKAAQESGELESVYLKRKIDEAQAQLLFLSRTIDDFREFYSPQGAKSRFLPHDAVQETILLVKEMLEHHGIEIEVTLLEQCDMYGYKNDLKQVLLNLITNAKEVLVERGVSNPKIDIVIDKHTIALCDNGGGIDNSMMHRIFEPYFSTKAHGSGIGLYMTKTILEKHMGATIDARNDDKGACFTIRFKR